MLPRHRITTNTSHACAYAAVLLILAGCASRGQPVPNFTAATPAEAFSRLLQISREWKGIRSYLKIQVIEQSGRRRFSARLQVDQDFRMLLEGMTPLGTVAFVLWVDGEDASFMNHLNRTVWRGSFAELSRSLGLGSEMTVPGLISLLLALPDPAQEYVPCNPPAGGDQCSSDGVWRISVTPSGVSAIERKGVVVEIRSEYLPPAFPPQGLEIRARNAHGDVLTQLNVEHLEVMGSPGRVKPPAVDPAYRCCPPPVFSENSSIEGDRP